MLSDYQKEFIGFLIRSKALLFGEFKLKSGRTAPYFINSGNFNSGALIGELGGFYASHIMKHPEVRPNVIFGPAYKGIPLAVTTSISLAKDFAHPCYYSFDRKEVKDHGDGGRMVGKKLEDGDQVVIVEDVVTAGTTLKEIVPMLRTFAKVEISAVVISVDRKEKGDGELSAVSQLQKNLEIKILPIVDINQIIEYLSNDNPTGLKLEGWQLEKIKEYRSQYGAND